ncbi:uncharacterized protein LOC110022039 [Phalaenopsis equestris]|uniref:uncharacterized protein LOC110022039 n=1 Tax=Phalaenopsis equestris TaxID=78828 RepID=UPI0009E5912B|nr:uncharacterized protein LOC110022039 [Phalaenopsis equestris]
MTHHVDEHNCYNHHIDHHNGADHSFRFTSDYVDLPHSYNAHHIATSILQGFILQLVHKITDISNSKFDALYLSWMKILIEVWDMWFEECELNQQNFETEAITSLRKFH